MSIYDFLQHAVITLIVLFSALYLLRRLLPKWVNARQQALANMLSQPSHAFILRKIGNFFQPGESSGGSCSSGCGSCSGCASHLEVEEPSELNTIKFQRHS